MSWVNLLDVIYPVGAVYFSTLSTSPASTVGGTWTQLTGGLLGLADSAGIAVAGSNGGSTTISVDQMPIHQHSVYVRRINTTPMSGGNTMVVCHPSNGYGTDNATGYMNETGGGQDFIPAHSSVYGWRRTA